MRGAATILHVDLDAFYASVEQRDDPSLRGKPVLVGGPPPRGVVAAASYEARRFGARSAIPMARALSLCPQAIVIPLDLARYAEASREFFAILGTFSPLVEGLSLDEAFLDVAGEERLFGDGPGIARRIKQRVRDELRLVASVGVAPSKFVAKIASDIDKPDGLRVVSPDQVLAFLHALPVSRLWGVGEVARGKLAALGLETIGDVARYPEALLCKRLGASAGAHLAALARGDDPRDVVPDRGAVSVGHEQTFDTDLASRDELAPILRHQADRVGARLRKSGKRARVVTIKIKFADFQLVTRRRTLPDPTSDGDLLGRVAVELLEQVPLSQSVRLCGVSAGGLEQRDGQRQLTLDEPTRERGERLGDTLDRIADKFGDGVIGRARPRPRPRKPR